MGFSFAFGTEAWRLSFVSDLGWDILIFGFEDKSFCFNEEILNILEDEFVVAVFFIDFWFLASEENLQEFRFVVVISVFPLKDTFEVLKEFSSLV